MSIFDVLKAPIDVTGPSSNGGGAFKSLSPAPLDLKSLEAPPIPLPKASPLALAGRPLKAPAESITPKASPFDIIGKPLPSDGVQVRRQDWQDVGNLPSLLGAKGFNFVAQPLASAASQLFSLYENATGKQSGKVGVDFKVPVPFPHKVSVTDGDYTHQVDMEDEDAKASFDTEGVQRYQNDLLEKGVDPDQAYKMAKDKAINDAINFLLIGRELGKFGLVNAFPEKAITPEVSRTVIASREAIKDAISGRAGYAGQPALPPEIEAALKAADGPTKLQIMKSAGVDVMTAKPSTLGAIFGVSEEEAAQLLDRLKQGTRPAPSGYLPGYKRGDLAPAFGLSTERRVPVGFGEPFRDFTDLSSNLLGKLEGRSTVSKQFIADLTNSADLKQPERDLVRRLLQDEGETVNVPEFANKVKSELLPLKRTGTGIGGYQDTKYEGVTLPRDLRGPVANYTEHTYQSPIKTSAGGVHFNERENPNYFAHSRIEDLPAYKNGSPDFDGGGFDGDTRRVIEIQSDLFQKGRLELDADKVRRDNAPDLQQKYGRGEITFEEYEKGLKERSSGEYAKLEPYRNTWHERVIREEVKQAAIDGKTKLQFPTGETAMKIEGLGTGGTTFRGESPRGGYSGVLKPEDLTVGKKVLGHGSQEWVITDVLGDGKFKAVQKRFYDEVIHDEKELGKVAKERLDRTAEEFDISGKVDTSNPIYKFYEKEVGRYLKNKYGATLVTDPQGVKWWEVKVKPEHGREPVQAFKKGEFKGDLSPAEAEQKLRTLFTAEEVGLVFDPALKKEGAIGLFTRGPNAYNAETRAMVHLLEEGGKVSNQALYHEAFHAYFNTFMSEAERNELLTTKDEETLADELADYARTKQGASWLTRLYDRLRAFFKKLTRFEETYEDILSRRRGAAEPVEGSRFMNTKLEKQALEAGDFDEFYDRSGVTRESLDATAKNKGFKDAADFYRKTKQASQPVIPADIRSEHELINPEQSAALEKIDEEARRLEDMREVIITHRARSLSKFANKNGELPEVLGHGTSKFARKGDDIVDQLGYPDSEAAREDYQRYRQLTQTYERDVRAFKIGKRLLMDKMKAFEVGAGPGHELGFNDDITQANHGITPPRGRNDVLQPPEIDFSKAKDKATLRLTRDTMERNLEKIFSPEDAAKLNRFLVEPVRENELEKVQFTNETRREVRAKIKELGLKAGSNDDTLIHVFGEGRMTLEELRKASPKKYQEIQTAALYFRNLYDHLLDEWNARRRVYGYADIGKRHDYFRHFDDINEWTRQFGLVEKDSQLPTELAGKTANFKPGKPFSTAELHRTGDRTSFSAIRGMDNYLDSVGRQMFHIDSVQRGRVLGKYIDEVAKASKQVLDPESGIVKPLHLANFAANLGEWTNLVSGKAALFDRAIESTVGRPVVRFLQKIKDNFGANVIAGNISAAISHSIPLSYNLATTDTVSAIRGLLDTLVAPLRPEGSLTTIDGRTSSFLVRRFPVEHISATVFQNAKSTLGFVFRTVDQFISRLAVSSKYFEGKSQGLSPEAAMKRADNYAQRVIGDRSVGNLPNIMSTRTLGFLTQFQVEVNDNLQVLIHDIPRFSGEDGTLGKKKAARTVQQLIKFAIYIHIFNLFYKKIKGSGKGLDPLGLVEDLFGWSDETKDLGFGARAKAAGSELLGELPFSSVVTGNYPLKQALTPVGGLAKDIGTGDFGQAGRDATKLASEFLSPVGGGAQALKTYQGLQAVREGGTVDTKGRLKSKVEPSFGHYVKGALFGPTALNSEANLKANSLYERLDAQKLGSADLTRRAEDLDTHLQAMTPDEANKEVEDIAQKDPALYDKLKKVVKERKAGLTQEERLMKQLGVSNGERARYVDEQIMKIQGGDAAETSAKRNAYLDALVEKGVVTPNVLEQLKELRQEGKSLPVVKDDTRHSDTSIIDRVETYAHAIGVDPLTAFNRIFTGQSIKRVDNGTIIVERMSRDESSALKNSMGGSAEMTLDHIIPLELGGSNAKDNLALVPKAEAAAADDIENLLGEALTHKRISKALAQDLITRFKHGVINATDVRAALNP